MMRRFLLALLFIALLAVPRLEARASEFTDDSCSLRFGSGNLSFAHCEGAQRDFGTVVIAIPGWRGTCRETFGLDEGSLYSVLESRRFYDWDCYQYDSQSWKLQQSAAGLADRVMALKALGYDDVMFITHSTGGVVALEYLTSRLFDHDQGRYIRRQAPDEQLEGLPDVFGSVMWMSPINGLEWYVSFAALFTMEDQQSLPDLAQDSDYLNGLKQRLIEYGQWRDGLDGQAEDLADAQLLFLQSRIDGVVPYIDPQKDEWLWPRPYAEVQDVPLGHTDMTMGRPDLLYLPAYLNDNVVVLRAPLTVRTDEVFSRAGANQSSILRQEAVISGVSYYAERNFDRAIVPAVNLMVFMLTEQFARSRNVDLQIVDILLDLFERELSDPEVAQKAYFPLMRALRNHDFSRTSAQDATGSPEYVQKILSLIDLILASVENEFRVQIETEAFGAILRIATTTRSDVVRDAALNLTAAQIATSSTDALVGSDILSGLATQYYTPRANLLPESSKSAIADAFTAALRREDEGTAVALGLISSEVDFNGERQPLWRSLQSTEFTDFLNDFRNQATDLEVEMPPSFERQLLQLDLEMLMGVGYDGRSVSIASEALNRLNAIPVDHDARSFLLASEPVTSLDGINLYPGLSAEARRTLGLTYGSEFEQLYFPEIGATEPLQFQRR